MDLIHHFVLEGTAYTIDTKWQNNEPLFKASDIAKVLGISNVRSSLASFTEDDKVARTTDTPGGPQQMTYLREYAAYRLVMNSRKPIAEPFQRWLCSVAVSIRERGIYELQGRLEEVSKNAKLQSEKITHDTLISAFQGPGRPVIYFGIIRNDNIPGLVKIGRTHDVSTRARDLAVEFGSFAYCHVFDCAGNNECEAFLHKHDMIRPFAYKGEIYNGKSSTEAFQFTDEQLAAAVNVTKRNLHRFKETRRITNAMRDAAIMETLKLLKTEKEVDASQTRLQEQPSTSLSEPVSKTVYMIYPMDDERRYTQARGNKVQRYSPDGNTLLRTYTGFAEAARDPSLDSPVDHVIKKAAANKTIYKGFRWAELDRDLDDSFRQDIGQTVEMPTQRKGFVAMLHLDRSHIVRVFCDQLEAAQDRQFRGCAPISSAIKRGSQSGGHYFRMWCDCPEDLKDEYLSRVGKLPQPRVRGNANVVQQLHPLTRDVVATFSSVAHVIKEFRMSRGSLQNAIETDRVMKGYRWTMPHTMHENN